MTLDKTLQKIIQRAELGFKIKTKEHAEWLANNTKNGVMPQYFCGVEQENCRLKELMTPLIVGLCEEVQRLRGKLEWIDLRCPEIFINDTNKPHKIHVEAAYDAGVCASAALSTSTSALEKLGGGDD